jgi:putative transposase
MARRPRLTIVGVPQHVIQRGNNRQATFFADEDYRLFLAYLSEAARKHDCSVHAYVLMTNHVHLLLTPRKPDAVSRTLQDVGRRYVQYVNFTYRRSGTLWEGRFKASLVDTQQYFLACCRYLELNPVRAGIAKAPEDYPWSSYRHYALGQENGLLSAHEEYRALGTTEVERQSTYRALFSNSVDETGLQEIREMVNRGSPLGSERFKDEIEAALERAARPPRRGRPRKSARLGAESAEM